jgi:hypothetical protein
MNSRRILSVLIAFVALAPAAALAQSPDQPANPPTEPTPPTPTPPTPPVPTTPPSAEPPVVTAPVPTEPPKEEKKEISIHSKFDAQLYGFVEFDSILDSTQGLGDLAGNSTIARPGTYTGIHPQMMFGARNSRIGLKLGAPPVGSVKASAQLEMDFLGNQAGTPLATTALVSEQSFWQNPTFRFRHMNVKLETPAVDILIGQYWQLFGWQTMAHPNTVEIQGIAGQIYSRSPQIRLSKKITSGGVTVEVAVAASRPPQRASATPDGQAGVKLTLDKLKALHTAGSTGTSVDGLSVGVSVVGRRFAVDEFSATPHNEVTANGYGISLDALLPIIPATKEHHENALTLTGSYVTGAGIADLYQGLSGGVGQPALPNPGMLNPAPVYVPNVDPNLVLFYPTSAGTYTLHPIQWTSYIVGLQYYLPPAGNVWVSANYSHMSSDNAHAFGATNKVWDTEDWADANLMFDCATAVRLGFELAWTQQQYLDGKDGTDYRGQFSAFFLF